MQNPSTLRLAVEALDSGDTLVAALEDQERHERTCVMCTAGVPCDVRDRLAHVTLAAQTVHILWQRQHRDAVQALRAERDRARRAEAVRASQLSLVPGGA